MLKVFALIFLLCHLTFAAEVNLEWDHSATEGVTGYKIYYGNASRAYTKNITVGYQTTATVTGLDRGAWYFAATAINATDESDYSNEVIQILGGCDLNKDSAVNVMDLQIMYNMILKVIPADLLYDMNGDGDINVMDSQILTNVILGKVPCP